MAQQYLHKAWHRILEMEIDRFKFAGIETFAYLLIQQQQTKKGLALLGFVLYHPMVSGEYEEDIYSYLSYLALDKADPTVATQLEQGKKLVLEDIVKEITTKLETMQKQNQLNINK